MKSIAPFVAVHMTKHYNTGINMVFAGQRWGPDWQGLEWKINSAQKTQRPGTVSGLVLLKCRIYLEEVRRCVAGQIGRDH